MAVRSPLEGPRASRLDVPDSYSLLVQGHTTIVISLLEFECFEAVPQKEKELRPR